MVKSNKAKGKKNVIKGITIAALTLGVVGAAFAYFTAQAQQKQNTFSIVGNGGGIDIEEPEWPGPQEDLVPGTYVKKDPFVVSSVDYDGWVVMKVTVPKIQASLNKQAGSYQVATFEADTTKYTLLNSEDVQRAIENPDATEVVYFYGYNDKVYAKKNANPAAVHSEDDKTAQLNNLGKANATTELFKEIKIQNFDGVDENAAGTEMSVDVDAMIIQSINPNSETGAEFANVTEAFGVLGQF